jgi:hypothetical protein
MKYETISVQRIIETRKKATAEVVFKVTPNHYLIHIKFNIYQWHPLIHLIVMFSNTVNSFWYIFKHQIEVKLILISRGAKVMLQAYDIWVIKNLHCLQLTVLVPCILKNFLYSYSLTSFQTSGLNKRCICIKFENKEYLQNIPDDLDIYITK